MGEYLAIRGKKCNFVHRMKDMQKAVLYMHLILLVSLASTVVSCGGDDGLGYKARVETNDEDEDNTSASLNAYYVYKLPVVFHVLYVDAKDATQRVPASRLQTIINNVNDLLEGDIYGKSANLNVRLVMAAYDENGKKLSTPGVDYIQLTGDYPIDPNEVMTDRTGKYSKYIWDPNEYVNIMLYHFAQNDDNNGATLGISHIPYTFEGDDELEGLTALKVKTLTKSMIDFAYCSSINSVYINDESTRYNRSDKGKAGYTYNSSDINVTIAHELGHYLGLLHTYTERDGEQVDSCGDTDYCTDTPSYNRNEYDTYLTDYLKKHSGERMTMNDLVKRASCDGNTFESTNMMDYSIGYAYAFSEEQKKRVRNVLYYSPLIPGPKKNRTEDTRSNAPAAPVRLPIRTIK